MLEQTPLHQRAAAGAAEFVEDRGWFVPARFTEAVAEYWQTRQQVSLFDVSHRGKLQLLGPDAKAFLHNLSSNDIRALKPGEGSEAFLATAKAKLVAHVLAYLLARPDEGESVWLDVAPGASERALKHLDHFLISEQLEMLDRTRDFAQIHLAGPQAPGLLAQVLREQMPDLREHEHLERPVAGAAACQIRRHEPLGVPGFDVVCPAASAVAVWEQLLTEGARPAGKAAFDILRIEAGTPAEGVDFDENNLVMELGRTGRAISFTKGCFPGQEPIVRSRDLGHVNWSFQGLRLAGAGPVSPTARVVRGDKEVGRVTSSAVSPRLGSTIALAFVRRGSDTPGTSVEVVTGDERRTAEVTALPFSD